MVIRLLLEIVGDSQLYIALEFLNAICAGATALLLVRLSRQLFSNKAAVMTGLFSFFFLPLFLYSTFAYGNVPSLPFALAAILWQSKFMETKTWRHLIFAAMAITVSILLKSTMIVVLMAMCLILLIHAAVKRSWRGIAGIIVPIMVYIACSHGFFAVMEKKYDVVTDNGLGKTTWIAMGLQGDEYGNRLPDAPHGLRGRSIRDGTTATLGGGKPTTILKWRQLIHRNPSNGPWQDLFTTRLLPFDSLRKNRRLFGLTPLMNHWSMAIGLWYRLTIVPLPCPIVL